MPAKLKAKQAKVEAKKADVVSKSKDAKVDNSASKSKGKAPEPAVTKAKGKVTPPVVVPPAPKKEPAVKKTNSKDASKAKSAKKDSPAKVPSPPKKPDSPAKSAPKRKGTIDNDKKDATSGIKKTKSDEQIVKVITKGGAAVDALVPNKDTYRVYQENGKSYSATLNQSNLDQNNNKFYIVQVLQD